MKRPILRGIALCLILAFAANDFAWASEGLARLSFFREPLVRFKLPDSAATIVETYRSPSRNAATLILLQDAHTNESAQFNLARALEAILESERIRTVFVEAGFGDVSLSDLRGRVTAERRRRVASTFLRAGELSGAEYASLVSEKDFALRGVEDENLYWESVALYASIARDRGKFDGYLRRIETTIAALKPSVYSPALAEFDALRSKYKAGELPATSYYAQLLSAARRFGVRGELPALDAFVSLRSAEAAIDFKKAGDEQMRALASIPTDVTAEWAAGGAGKGRPARLTRGDRSSERAFHAFLAESVADLSRYPEFSKYLAYLDAAEKVDAAALIGEAAVLEAKIFEAMFREEDERTLFEASEELTRLKGLLDLSLTPDEFDAHRRESPRMDAVRITAFLNRKIMESRERYGSALFLEDGYADFVRRAEEFYAATYRRDAAFVKNAVTRMNESGESKAVLVAGGYHTPNLKALLKRLDVSYVCVTPRVVNETNRARYEKLLLGQTAPKPGAADKIGVLCIENRNDGPKSPYARFLTALDVPYTLAGARLGETLDPRREEKILALARSVAQLKWILAERFGKEMWIRKNYAEQRLPEAEAGLAALSPTDEELARAKEVIDREERESARRLGFAPAERPAAETPAETRAETSAPRGTFITSGRVVLAVFVAGMIGLLTYLSFQEFFDALFQPDDPVPGGLQAVEIRIDGAEAGPGRRFLPPPPDFWRNAGAGDIDFAQRTVQDHIAADKARRILTLFDTVYDMDDVAATNKISRAEAVDLAFTKARRMEPDAFMLGMTYAVQIHDETGAVRVFVVVPVGARLAIPEGWLDGPLLDSDASRESVERTVLDYLRKSPVGRTRYQIFAEIVSPDLLQALIGERGEDILPWVLRMTSVSNQLGGQEAPANPLVARFGETFDDLKRRGVVRSTGWTPERLVLAGSTDVPGADWAATAAASPQTLAWFNEDPLSSFHGDTMGNVGSPLPILLDAAGAAATSAVVARMLEEHRRYSRARNANAAEMIVRGHATMAAVRDIGRTIDIRAESIPEKVAENLDAFLAEIDNYVRATAPLAAAVDSLAASARLRELPAAPPITGYELDSIYFERARPGAMTFTVQPTETAGPPVSAPTQLIVFGKLAEREARLLHRMASEERFARAAHHVPTLVGAGRATAADAAHIERIHDIAPGDPYFVAAYPGGTDAASLIERAEKMPMTDDQAMAYVRLMVQAVAELNADGIAHGTLSSEEFFVDAAAGTSIITDLETALILDDAEFGYEDLRREDLLRRGNPYAGFGSDWFSRDAQSLFSILNRFLSAVERRNPASSLNQRFEAQMHDLGVRERFASQLPVRVQEFLPVLESMRAPAGPREAPPQAPSGARFGIPDVELVTPIDDNIFFAVLGEGGRNFAYKVQVRIDGEVRDAVMLVPKPTMYTDDMDFYEAQSLIYHTVKGRKDFPQILGAVRLNNPDAEHLVVPRDRRGGRPRVLVFEFLTEGVSPLDFAEVSARTAAWTPHQRKLFLLSLVDSMIFLRQNHVIHRDLKWKNILIPTPLLTQTGWDSKFLAEHPPVIMDFDISMVLSQADTAPEEGTIYREIYDREQGLGISSGSARWVPMPEEQTVRFRDFSKAFMHLPKYDMFGFGLLFAQLMGIDLTGETLRTEALVKTDEADWLEEPMRDVLRRLLRKDIEFQDLTWEEVYSVLQRSIEEEPLPPNGPSGARVSTDPVLSEPFIEYARAIRGQVNPAGRPLKAVYGGAGADAQSFLLATDAAEGYFVSRYDGMTAADLARVNDLLAMTEKELESTDNLGRFAMLYRSDKGVNGFTNNEYVKMKPRVIGGLALELKALGVKRIEIDEEGGLPRISFDWKHPDAPQSARRSIVFADADVTDPSAYPPALVAAVDSGFDVYYQRAGFTIARFYSTRPFMGHLGERLRPGGFTITDDVGFATDVAYDPSAIMDFSDDFPLDFESVHSPDVQAKAQAAFGEKKSRSVRDMYGWFQNVRRKPSGARMVADRLRAPFDYRVVVGNAAVTPPNYAADAPVKLGVVFADIDHTLTDGSGTDLKGEQLRAVADALVAGKPFVMITGSPYFRKTGSVVAKNSVRSRVTAPLVRELLSRGRIDALSNLTVHYVSGLGKVSFRTRLRVDSPSVQRALAYAASWKPLGRLLVRLLVVETVVLRTDRAMTRETEITIARALGAALVGVRRGMSANEYDPAILWPFEAETDPARMPGVVSRETGLRGVELQAYGSELVIEFKDPVVSPDGREVMNLARRILESRPGEWRGDYFYSGGAEYAKLSLFSKAETVRAEIAAIRPDGAVLGFGDSNTDDFLTLAEADLPPGTPFFGTYLGKAAHMEADPRVIVARKADGSDETFASGYDGAARAIDRFLEAERAELAYRDLPLWAGGLFSQADLEAQGVTVVPPGAASDAEPLRRATDDDVEAILDLWEAQVRPFLADTPPSRDEFRGFLRRKIAAPNSLVSVVQIDGSVAGYSLAASNPSMRLGTIGQTGVNVAGRATDVEIQLTVNNLEWFREETVVEEVWVTGVPADDVFGGILLNLGFEDSGADSRGMRRYVYRFVRTAPPAGPAEEREPGAFYGRVNVVSITSGRAASFYHTSYLNRYPDQAAYLRAEVFPRIIRRRAAAGERRIRTLSIGAATGEELARTYHEIVGALRTAGERVEDWDIRVTGLETDALVAAAGIDRIEGRVPFSWAVTEASSADDRYAVEILKTLNENPARFRDSVRLLHFVAGATDSPLASVADGTPDLVFANNAFYQMTPEAKRRTVEQLSAFGTAWVAGTTDFGESAKAFAAWAGRTIDVRGRVAYVFVHPPSETGLPRKATVPGASLPGGARMADEEANLLRFQRYEAVESFLSRRGRTPGPVADGTVYQGTPVDVLPRIFNVIEELRPLAGSRYRALGAGLLNDSLIAHHVLGMEVDAVEKDETIHRAARAVYNDAAEIGMIDPSRFRLARGDALDVPWTNSDVVYFFYTQSDAAAREEFERKLVERMREMKPGSIVAFLYTATQLIAEQDDYPVLRRLLVREETISDRMGGLFLHLYRVPEDWDTVLSGARFSAEDLLALRAVGTPDVRWAYAAAWRLAATSRRDPEAASELAGILVRTLADPGYAPNATNFELPPFYALQWMGPLEAAALDSLRAVAEDTSLAPFVRVRAIRAYAALVPSDAARESLLAALLFDVSDAVAQRAAAEIALLDKIGDATLETLAAQLVRPEMRTAVLPAMGRHAPRDNAAVVARVRAVLAEPPAPGPEAPPQAAALRALAAMRASDEETLAELRRLTQSPFDDVIRAESLHALGRSGNDAPPNLRVLEAVFARDAEYLRVRQAAAVALGELAERSEAALDVLDRLANGPHAVTALYAAAGIAHSRRTDARSEASVVAAIVGAQDNVWTVDFAAKKISERPWAGTAVPDALVAAVAAGEAFPSLEISASWMEALSTIAPSDPRLPAIARRGMRSGNSPLLKASRTALIRAGEPLSPVDVSLLLPSSDTVFYGEPDWATQLLARWVAEDEAAYDFVERVLKDTIDARTAEIDRPSNTHNAAAVLALAGRVSANDKGAALAAHMRRGSGWLHSVNYAETLTRSTFDESGLRAALRSNEPRERELAAQILAATDGLISEFRQETGEPPVFFYDAPIILRRTGTENKPAKIILYVHYLMKVSHLLGGPEVIPYEMDDGTAIREGWLLGLRARVEQAVEGMTVDDLGYARRALDILREFVPEVPDYRPRSFLRDDSGADKDAALPKTPEEEVLAALEAERDSIGDRKPADALVYVRRISFGTNSRIFRSKVPGGEGYGEKILLAAWKNPQVSQGETLAVVSAGRNEAYFLTDAQRVRVDAFLAEIQRNAAGGRMSGADATASVVEAALFDLETLSQRLALPENPDDPFDTSRRKLDRLGLDETTRKLVALEANLLRMASDVNTFSDESRAYEALARRIKQKLSESGHAPSGARLTSRTSEQAAADRATLRGILDRALAGSRTLSVRELAQEFASAATRAFDARLLKIVQNDIYADAALWEHSGLRMRAIAVRAHAKIASDRAAIAAFLDKAASENRFVYPSEIAEALKTPQPTVVFDIRETPALRTHRALFNRAHQSEVPAAEGILSSRAYFDLLGEQFNQGMVWYTAPRVLVDKTNARAGIVRFYAKTDAERGFRLELSYAEKGRALKAAYIENDVTLETSDLQVTALDEAGESEPSPSRSIPFFESYPAGRRFLDRLHGLPASGAAREAAVFALLENHADLNPQLTEPLAQEQVNLGGMNFMISRIYADRKYPVRLYYDRVAERRFVAFVDEFDRTNRVVLESLGQGRVRVLGEPESVVTGKTNQVVTLHNFDAGARFYDRMTVKPAGLLSESERTRTALVQGISIAVSPTVTASEEPRWLTAAGATQLDRVRGTGGYWPVQLVDKARLDARAAAAVSLPEALADAALWRVLPAVDEWEAPDYIGDTIGDVREYFHRVGRQADDDGIEWEVYRRIERDDRYTSIQIAGDRVTYTVEGVAIDGRPLIFSAGYQQLSLFLYALAESDALTLGTVPADVAPRVSLEPQVRRLFPADFDASLKGGIAKLPGHLRRTDSGEWTVDGYVNVRWAKTASQYRQAGAEALRAVRRGYHETIRRASDAAGAQLTPLKELEKLAETPNGRRALERLQGIMSETFSLLEQIEKESEAMRTGGVKNQPAYASTIKLLGDKVIRKAEEELPRAQKDFGLAPSLVQALLEDDGPLRDKIDALLRTTGARMAGDSSELRRARERARQEIEAARRILRHFPKLKDRYHKGADKYAHIDSMLSALYGGDAVFHSFKHTSLGRSWQAHSHFFESGLLGLLTRQQLRRHGLDELLPPGARPKTPAAGTLSAVQVREVAALAQSIRDRVNELGIRPRNFVTLKLDPAYQNPFWHSVFGRTHETKSVTPAQSRLERAIEVGNFTAQDETYLRSFESHFQPEMIVNVLGAQVSLLAIREVHNTARGPGKGGQRFVFKSTLQADREAFLPKFDELKKRMNLHELRYFLRRWVGDGEVKPLAFLMTVKGAVADLPYGGAKGVVLFADVEEPEPGQFVLRDFNEGLDEETSRRLRASVLRDLTLKLSEAGLIGPYTDIPAPDLGSGSWDMDICEDEYLKHFLRRARLGGDFAKYPADLQRLLDDVDEAARGKDMQTLVQTRHLQAVTSYLAGLRDAGTPIEEDSPLAGLSAAVGTFTAKTIENGGSNFRPESTGFGVHHVLKALASLEFGSSKKLQGETAKIEGLGGVGLQAALEAIKDGVRVQAIAERSGVVYLERGFSLEDIEALRQLLKTPGQFAQLNDGAPGHAIPDARLVSKDEFLELPTFVFYACAKENSITAQNAAKLQAEIVIEGANGAVTNEAYDMLLQGGTLVIPDSLANAGGVATSYFEWQQNRLNQKWPAEMVVEMLKGKLTQAVVDVNAMRIAKKTDWRTAIDVLAIQRILAARDSGRAVRAAAAGHSGARLAAVQEAGARLSEDQPASMSSKTIAAARPPRFTPAEAEALEAFALELYRGNEGRSFAVAFGAEAPVFRLEVEADGGRAKAVSVVFAATGEVAVRAENPDARLAELRSADKPRREAARALAGEGAVALLRASAASAETAVPPVLAAAPVAHELPVGFLARLADPLEFDAQKEILVRQILDTRRRTAFKNDSFFLGGLEALDAPRRQSLETALAAAEASLGAPVASIGAVPVVFDGVVMRYVDASAARALPQRDARTFLFSAAGLDERSLLGWTDAFLAAHSAAVSFGAQYDSAARRVDTARVASEGFAPGLLEYYNSRAERKIADASAFLELLEGRTDLETFVLHGFRLPVVARIPLQTLLRAAEAMWRSVRSSA